LVKTPAEISDSEAGGRRTAADAEGESMIEAPRKMRGEWLPALVSKRELPLVSGKPIRQGFLLVFPWFSGTFM
jgi:hypothetical protein